MSCCLLVGLAFQFIPAPLLEPAAPAAGPAGSTALFNPDFARGGETLEPEWGRICQSLQLACCHHGHTSYPQSLVELELWSRQLVELGR